MRLTIDDPATLAALDRCAAQLHLPNRTAAAVHMIREWATVHLECQRCTHRWMSRDVRPPAVCPHCKSRQWQTARAPIHSHACGRCEHTWTSRSDSPLTCPNCRSSRWRNYPAAGQHLSCLRCQHTWKSRGAPPLACPRCHSRAWQSEPLVCPCCGDRLAGTADLRRHLIRCQSFHADVARVATELSVSVTRDFTFQHLEDVLETRERQLDGEYDDDPPTEATETTETNL